MGLSRNTLRGMIEMELTKIKRRDLKRGDMFCDANGMLDRPVMMLFIDEHTHHYDPDTEVYRIDALKVEIAERDNEYAANATDLELLDAMLEIINPIIQSGEYSHPAQSSRFLSREMSKLCHQVTAFRRQHNIVG